MDDSGSDLDCAVCLQKCHHPTKLPCGHIFCFLCVKGIAIQSKKCAMCRAAIPTDYFKNPVLLENEEDLSLEQVEEPGKFQWYYEGRNGWWKYDERSNEELEERFNAGDSRCSLLLAGTIYDIEFTSMLQMQHNNPMRRRRVKRDTPLLPAKGIAGIKKIDNRVKSASKDDVVTHNHLNEEIHAELIEIEDNDESDDELIAIVNSISVITLDEETDHQELNT